MHQPWRLSASSVAAAEGKRSEKRGGGLASRLGASTVRSAVRACVVAWGATNFARFSFSFRFVSALARFPTFAFALVAASTTHRHWLCRLRRGIRGCLVELPRPLEHSSFQYHAEEMPASAIDCWRGYVQAPTLSRLVVPWNAGAKCRHATR